MLTTSRSSARGTLAERRSEWVGSQVDRQDCALIGLDEAHQFEQGVAGGLVIGAGIENHRRHAQINAFEHLLQLCGQYTGLPHPDQQRADALGEPGEHRGVDLLRRHPGHPVGRNGLGDLPAGLDVAQRVGATQVGPLARQRRLGQLVERGVKRPDRDSLVGRGFQHLLGLRPEFVHLAPFVLLARTPATAVRHLARACSRSAGSADTSTDTGGSLSQYVTTRHWSVTRPPG